MITTALPLPLTQGEKEKFCWLKDWLDKHFLEELSLSHLARISLLNEFKLKKGFRQLHGCTVFSHIRRLRMEHAAKLLRGGVSVTEAAFELGYEHPQHFSTAYKKYTGFRPGFICRERSMPVTG